MTRTLRGLSLAATTAVLATTAALLPSGTAQATTGTVHGCPRGAVCIYPQNKGWNHDHPQAGGVFWSYGPHNLRGQHGNHYVLNNQTDTRPDLSVAAGCTGYNGTGKNTSYKFFLFPWISASAEYRNTNGERGYSWDNLNLTPVNSVVLTTPSGRDWCAFR